MNWFLIALGAIPMFILCLLLHNWDIGRIEKKQIKAIDNQVLYDIKQCKDSDKISTDASSAYEDEINGLNILLDGLRNKAPSIVYIAAKTSGSNATSAKSVCTGANAVNPAPLITIAGVCEKYRLQVIGLQDIINKTWALNNQ